MSQPKVLLFDIETAPILGYCWSIWEQNIAINQIKSDWHLLSWCAKWLDDAKIMYQDQRHAKNIEDDKKILQGIWKLLDEADIVITQNGISFDSKKLNARFILNGMGPPSPYKHIDTKRLAKKHFAFTSNRLEYLSEKLNKKCKKEKHFKYAGFELWKACLSGDMGAWKEMERYNKMDVLSLEELYKKLQPWDNSIRFDVYADKYELKCNCGSSRFEKRGYRYQLSGKYQRFQCKNCGAWHSSRKKE